MMLWSLRTSKGRRFDGIGLVDFRRRDELFLQTIQNALQLIKEHDTRRYSRVRKHIAWIVNQVNNSLGAQYQRSIRACFLQFEDAPELERDVFIAFHSCTLIHEATHGLIESHGIRFTSDYSARIERLCTIEQNRFAAGLSACDANRYPSALLQLPFDEQYWASEWGKSGRERANSFAKRWLADIRSN
jgi:hypothetical protein